MVISINNIAIGNLFHVQKAAFKGWDERPQGNTLWSVASIQNGKIEVNNNGLMPIDAKCLKPIPLTVQWLKDFGFVKMRDTSIFTLRSAAFVIELHSETFEFKIGSDFIKSIKFVHELQNVYQFVANVTLKLKNDE